MSVKKIRLCAGMLAVLMAVTGCANATGGEKVEPVNPISVTENHYLENTLHKVTVTETERPFVVDGKTDYQIIAGEDESTQKAAFYLSTYVEKATGCGLDIISPKKYRKDGKYIIMNVPSLFEEAGLSMPEEDLGTVGYYIKTVDDNVFLSYNYDDGARFAMLAFLRNVLGFKMYELEAISFDKDGKTLPDMEIIEKPDVEYFCRLHNSGDPVDETYMMGFIQKAFVSVGGNSVHNSLNYLPMETYLDEHPEWYSTEMNELCYTAHGDKKELQMMVDIVADLMIEELANQPDLPYVACTIMDHTSACKCDACIESATKYNGSNAAAIVKFINRVNAKVQAELQRQADEKGEKKREVKVAFFAYNAYTQPPVEKTADGSFRPIDESVVCDDGVAVYYAPIKAQFNHTFYEDDNTNFNDMVKGWMACEADLLCWLYETNFLYYFYPYNCWDSMLETYRFCVEQGAVYLMNQDQHTTQCSTAFTDLKDYINSCAAINLNQDYDAILDDYFKNYYLSAEVPMRTYFNELRAWMRYLEAEYPAELDGDIYAEVSEMKFWPQMLLEHWLDLIDEAYEAAEAYRDDKVLYQNLRDRITKESMFMRFALIEHYSGTYSAEVLKEMQLSFKEDAQRLGFTYAGEPKEDDMTFVYEAWGVK